MSGELTPAQLAEDARRAAELLDFLEQHLAEMDTTAVDTWRSSKSTIQREEQWHAIQAIAALRHRLQARIDAPKFSQSRPRRNTA